MKFLSHLFLKSFVYLLILSTFIGSNAAAELSVRPFQASYALYSGSLNVANSELTLERSGDFWRWKLSSKPRGMYSLFSNKEPYSETTFSLSDESHRIHNILISDSSDKSKYETARFNWSSMEAEIQYNNNLITTRLKDDVYDFHTIHWLTAQMIVYEVDKTQFTFYLKGALVKAWLNKIGSDSLTINGKPQPAVVFEQTISQSQESLRYYYDTANPLVPLKIEKLSPGKKKSMLVLKKIHWN